MNSRMPDQDNIQERLKTVQEGAVPPVHPPLLLTLAPFCKRSSMIGRFPSATASFSGNAQRWLL
jgi:hypothetical protein